MISTMLSTATTLGLFISVFILIAPDGVFSLSTLYVEGDTSSRLSCKHDVPDHEFHRVKWFKSTNDDVYKNGEAALVSWDNTSDPIITDGSYSIDKDFSLVIHNLSIVKGIYRCSVTRNIPGDVVQYDVKVISYGKLNPAHTLPVQYGQHLRIPCSSNSTRDGKVSVVWFKGESRDCFKSDDQPIASSIEGRRFENYTLNDDFSLNIQNASTEYEAVYRSIVISTQETRPSARDTYVTVYGKVKPPHLSPVKHGELLKIPCSSNSTRASTVDVLWYKINSTGILNSDEEPIVSLIGGRRPDSNYTLTDDFSLEIQNVSIEDKAVYRCIAVSTEGSRPSASDTNVTVYALPREVPLTRHSFVNDSYFINCSVDHVYPLRFPELNFCLNCSVDHVYPMLFPELNFVSNNQTHNEDGTFNTSISVIVLHSVRNFTLECSFPYFNYTGKSSLFIPAYITDEDEELLPTDPSASTYPTHAELLGLAFGVVVLSIVLIIVVVVIRKRYTKQHQQKDEKISTPEMEPMV